MTDWMMPWTGRAGHRIEPDKGTDSFLNVFNDMVQLERFGMSFFGLQSEETVHEARGTKKGTKMRYVLAMILMFLPGLAFSGDYYHACVTPGGGYEYDHDSQTLTTKGNNGNRTVDYTVVRKVILEKRTGYCQSDSCNGRFNFEGQEYVISLKIGEPGFSSTLNFYCEVAASGLPAACNCDREVITAHQKLDPQYSDLASRQTDDENSRGNADILPEGDDRRDSRRQTANLGEPSSIWNHNGSTVDLYAEGAQRTLRYRSPRPEMRRACAEAGDTIFEGEKAGAKYVGEAAIFSCNCGRLTFPVSGRTTRNGTRIIVRGKAPRRDESCKTIGHQTSTLVFDYVRRP